MAENDYHFVVDNETLKTFGEIDYRIYSALHNHEDHLLDVRVAELAHEAHTSNAAVVRFCKKCGYSGLKELKQAYAHDVHKQRQKQPLPSVLKEMRLMVDEGDFAAYQRDIYRAFDVIRRAQSVALIGHGRSAGLAVYGANLFNDMEFPSLPLVSFPAYIPEGAQGKAALVISHHGETPEVVTVTNELSAKGCQVIAVTARADSPIARLSDVCICYGEPSGGSLSSVDLSTRIPALYVIEQLARHLYNDRMTHALMQTP